MSVDVGRKSFSNSDISDIGEEEFINQISILETDGLIAVKFRTPERNLTYSISVVLHSGIINYFDNKRKQKKQKRSERIRFWIPVSISILALAVSILALLLELQVIQPVQHQKSEMESTSIPHKNFSYRS